jgi:hypothetical protein
MTQMGEDIGGRVGEEFDIVAATRQCPFDVSRIEDFEKLQHACPVKIGDHPLSAARHATCSVIALIPLQFAGRINQEKDLDIVK